MCGMSSIAVMCGMSHTGDAARDVDPLCTHPIIEAQQVAANEQVECKTQLNPVQNPAKSSSKPS